MATFAVGVITLIVTFLASTAISVTHYSLARRNSKLVLAVLIGVIPIVVVMTYAILAHSLRYAIVTVLLISNTVMIILYERYILKFHINDVADVASLSPVLLLGIFNVSVIQSSSL